MPRSVRAISPTLAERAGSSGHARVAGLLDDGSFVPHPTVMPQDPAPGAGSGTIEGRVVRLYVHPGRCLEATAAAGIAATVAGAVRDQVPIVSVHGVAPVSRSGADGRACEQEPDADATATVLAAHAAAAGRIPQLALVLGPCIGAAAYTTALADVTIVSDAAALALTTSRDVTAVTGEDVDARALGGPDVHAERSGSAHLTVDDDAQAFALAREVLGYLPSTAGATSGVGEEPAGGGPDHPHHPDGPHGPGGLPGTRVPQAHEVGPRDVRDVVRGIVDAGRFLELQGRWARNLVVGFARLGGRAVGVVANQPRWLGGALDVEAAEKGARFVRSCDALGLPLVVLVDAPGFLPGVTQEHAGAVRRGASLVAAFAAATVPRLTVRLAVTAADVAAVMNPRALGADAVLAWPGAAEPHASGVDRVIAPHATRQALVAALGRDRRVAVPLGADLTEDGRDGRRS